ncbi:MULTISPECIES: glycosyltransferase [Cyanophyceae]|uniref:glycosyltransferase family 2 protein n=1 Tax=Cyanophyceae TaxID=3028117 RepID=UPI0016873502|nr:MULTISPECIES: glycosyltransferase [Cyanophyceae]MBD1918182.1 glycosyltransferase [Phormidium sp. FACHB-77]MBD2030214.1 glycosyltransferase [Phormidium sp. FACHB-322]MBD2051414.1 glycosyltransferase [Leptolyngbya sp. FACHB-60]
MSNQSFIKSTFIPVKKLVQWSVMIPTYNCAHYLRETLSSVLAQDLGPELMQIEVIDDCSTADNPELVVQDLGKGRVGFYRQSYNMGVPRNFETCLQRSHGRLIHLLHGDDYIRPGFYTKMQQAFDQSSEIGAAFCRQIFMDEQGHWQSFSKLEQPQSGILDNCLERLALEQRIMTPSVVVRREVYEKLGGFNAKLLCAEDWEMWVRIAANYPIWYEVEPLAVYRMHADSNTGRHVNSGEDIGYTRQAIDMFKAYLPTTMAERVAHSARTTYALAALDTAYHALVNGNLRATLNQGREALRLSRSFPVICKLVRVLLKGSMAYALTHLKSRETLV